MTGQTAKTPAASPVQLEFQDCVWKGLASRPKTLPCRYFYDAHGSELFEQITRLPEYYPTRTELGILEQNAAHLGAILPPDAVVVEFGSGSSLKTELLLRALQNPAAYVPIEISAAALFPAARRIHERFPNVTVLPLLRSFDTVAQLQLPWRMKPRIGFFPGSTIGNMDPEEAATFLRDVRKALGPKAKFIVGTDLKKPLDILIPAYDDAEGVTAAFNKNILARINRELGGTFDLESFRHEARYNAGLGRIEMHLVSIPTQTVSVAGRPFTFVAGESIHTENAHKYSIQDVEKIAETGGWSVAESILDKNELFSLHIFA